MSSIQDEQGWYREVMISSNVDTYGCSMFALKSDFVIDFRGDRDRFAFYPVEVRSSSMIMTTSLKLFPLIKMSNIHVQFNIMLYI